MRHVAYILDLSLTSTYMWVARGILSEFYSQFLSCCEINVSAVPSCTNRDMIVITPDTTKAIEDFERLASSGPLFICACCTQTWFKDGVKRTDTKKCFGPNKCE